MRQQAGQAIVELALTVPLMVFLLVGGADLARIFALQIAVENGARAGAESYAINQSPTAEDAETAAMNEINRTPTAAVTADHITVTKALSDGVTDCLPLPTVATPCFISVRVTYPWRTLVAWPFIPTSGTFDRTTVFRTFY